MTQTSDHSIGRASRDRGWRGGERILGMVDREGLKMKLAKRCPRCNRNTFLYFVEYRTWRCMGENCLQVEYMPTLQERIIALEQRIDDLEGRD